MNIVQRLDAVLAGWNFSPFGTDTAARVILGAAVILIAVLAWLITVKIIYRVLTKIVRRTRSEWDNQLIEKRAFRRLSALVPAVVIRMLAPAVLFDRAALLDTVTAAADAAFIIAVTLTGLHCLNFVNHIYSRRKDAQRRSIKGIIQALQVLIITAAVIMIISLLTRKPVSGLMAGLGAISAVLLLVFKDPLMGLIAGFQISSNDMVRIDDWIEVPKHGADGDVIDISLLNVTVRNWDKTLVTLPIQDLTTGAFKNWRGMRETGGRRIKRSLFIDLSSIRFLTPEEISRLGSITLLAEYLRERGKTIRRYNQENGADRGASPVNGRALTNIGVFRAYVLAYLRAHPKVHPDLTLLVRQLQSGPQGLPLEIYAFTSDTAWANYEEIQSDIFDHIFAVLGEFGLRVFQNPSGTDFHRLIPTQAARG